MLDLEKLRNFTTVVRAGSFVRAAEELNLSQPALSRSMQVLERQLGVRLLDRQRAGVRVTAVGRRVLEQAIDLLSNAFAIEKTVSAAAHGLAGTVRFGIGPFSATALLPEVLIHCASSGLNVNVEVTIGSGVAMKQQLLDDEIEFFIGLQDVLLGDPIFTCLGLTDISTRFFVRPNHPLAGKTRSLAEIEAYPIAAGEDLGGVLEVAHRGEAGHPPTFLVNNIHVLGEICWSTDTVLAAGHGAIRPGLVEVPIALNGAAPSRSTLGVISVRNRTPSPAAEYVRSELVRVARAVYR